MTVTQLKVPVEGHTDLVRDIRSGAIVNTNVRAAEMSKRRSTVFVGQNVKIEKTIKDMDDMKTEISEIKDMLKTLLARDTNNG